MLLIILNHVISMSLCLLYPAVSNHPYFGLLDPAWDIFLLEDWQLYHPHSLHFDEPIQIGVEICEPLKTCSIEVVALDIPHELYNLI